MPELQTNPVRFPVPGGKLIDEHVGRQSTGHKNFSVAHMRAPAGWEEPAQRPEFDEVTLVISGQFVVEGKSGRQTVEAGQSILARAGEKVRYSVGPDGAEYVAVCVPAFSLETVHRDE